MRVFLPNLNPQAFDRGHGVTVSTEMSVMLEFSHSGSRPRSWWSPKMETPFMDPWTKRRRADEILAQQKH